MICLHAEFMTSRAVRRRWDLVPVTRCRAGNRYFFLTLPGLPAAVFFLAGFALGFAEPDPLPPNTRSQPDANFFVAPVWTV
jgi:hypothetical protein